MRRVTQVSNWSINSGKSQVQHSCRKIGLIAYINHSVTSQMKKRQSNSSCALALILLATINFAQGQVPTVKKISEYKQTDFLPTLEHKLATGRNSIYCAS